MSSVNCLILSFALWLLVFFFSIGYLSFSSHWLVIGLSLLNFYRLYILRRVACCQWYALQIFLPVCNFLFDWACGDFFVFILFFLIWGVMPWRLGLSNISFMEPGFWVIEKPPHFKVIKESWSRTLLPQTYNVFSHYFIFRTWVPSSTMSF